VNVDLSRTRSSYLMRTNEKDTPMGRRLTTATALAAALANLAPAHRDLLLEHVDEEGDDDGRRD